MHGTPSLTIVQSTLSKRNKKEFICEKERKNRRERTREIKCLLQRQAQGDNGRETGHW